MRRLYALPVALLGMLCQNVIAHDPHEILTRLMERSDEIMLVDIAEEPSTYEDTLNVTIYVVECKIKAVYKGQSKPLSTVNVKVERHERNHERDRPSLLRKGATCILFARKMDAGSRPMLASTDQWFSVQPASPAFTGVLEKYRDKANEDKAKEGRTDKKGKRGER